MINITFDMVEESIPAIIAQEGPDFVYEAPIEGSCVYVHQGKPSCLIGRYLIDMGVPVEAFDGYQTSDIDTLFSRNFFENYGITATDEAVQIMRTLQYNQDNDLSWGDTYNKSFDTERY
jgi:hypothetical protein